MSFIKNYFSKKSIESGQPVSLFDGFGESEKKWCNLTFQALEQYYNEVSAINTVVDMIAEDCASLTPVLKDKKTGEIIYDHEFLMLLENPNQDLQYFDFMNDLVMNYLISGEVFISGSSMNEKREFLNLYSRKAKDVGLQSDQNNEIYQYQYNANNSSLLFTRENLKWRFFTQDKMHEITQVKTRSTANDNRGFSKVNKVLYEVLQHSLSSIHNVALLQNGARLMTALISKSNLNPANKKQILAQFKENYSGSVNAGKTMIISGGDFDLKNIAQSNKDLDFLNSRKEVTQIIYKKFEIPLALMDTGASTFNNYQNAMVQYYDNVITKQAQYILDKLWAFSKIRYKDGDKYTLTFDKTDIPFFEDIKLDLAKKKKDAGVYTKNEVRIGLGMDELDDNEIGKTLLNSSASNPVEEPTLEKDFEKALKQQGYSEKEIKEIIENESNK